MLLEAEHLPGQNTHFGSHISKKQILLEKSVLGLLVKVAGTWILHETHSLPLLSTRELVTNYPKAGVFELEYSLFQ